MSNTELGMSNDEVGQSPSTFAIQNWIFDIPALSAEVLAAKRENPLLRPRVGGFAGHRPARCGPVEREGRCPLG